MDKLYTVELSYLELSMLDEKVNQKAQLVIDKAREEWELGGGVLGEFLRRAIKTGRLMWTMSRIHYCPSCKKSAGYVPYARTSINHKKGDPNKEKPKTMRGINFNGMDRSRGICEECAGGEQTIRKAIDFIINGDYPVEIQPNPYRYSKYELLRTYTCQLCKEDYLLDTYTNLIVGGNCKCGKRSLSLVDKRKSDTMVLSPLYKKEKSEMVLKMAVESIQPGITRLDRMNNEGSLAIYDNRSIVVGYINIRTMVYSMSPDTSGVNGDTLKLVRNWMEATLPDLGFRREGYLWR